MPYQEKNAVISLFSIAIVFGFYFYFTKQNFSAGLFDGADAGVLIGKSILWLIFGGAIFQIIAQVVFHIIYVVIAKEPNTSSLVDERDKLIELRTLRVAYYIIFVGFVTAMIALAMGQSIFVTIHILLSFTVIAGIVESLMQIFLYRRGF